MAKFGAWTSTTDELPPNNRLVAVKIIVGHSARGSGIARYTVAQRVGDEWRYHMHQALENPPVAWTPLPDDTY